MQDANEVDAGEEIPPAEVCEDLYVLVEPSTGSTTPERWRGCEEYIFRTRRLRVTIAMEIAVSEKAVMGHLSVS